MAKFNSPRAVPELSLPGNFSHKVTCVHLKRFGEIEHDAQRRNVLAALEEPDVADVQISQFREPFLREAAVGSQAANDCPKCHRLRSSFFAPGHPCIMTMVGLYCRMTMVVIHVVPSGRPRHEERQA
jgi:hypothetical protein